MDGAGQSGKARPGDDFEALYLRQVTKEFADDLDKLRRAGDFTDASVPILVDALKQGAAMYSEDERRQLMGQQAEGPGVDKWVGAKVAKMGS